MPGINEEKTAAASYVLTFYQEVGQLTDQYAQYCNLLLELEAKHGSDNVKLEDTEKTTIQQAAQNVRYYALKCYVMYRTIKKGTDKKDDKAISDAFTKLKEEYIITTETLEKFVIGMNSALVTDVIKNLLQTSQDVIDTVYS